MGKYAEQPFMKSMKPQASFPCVGASLFRLDKRDKIKQNYSIYSKPVYMQKTSYLTEISIKESKPGYKKNKRNN